MVVPTATDESLPIWTQGNGQNPIRMPKESGSSSPVLRFQSLIVWSPLLLKRVWLSGLMATDQTVSESPECWLEKFFR